MALTKTPIELSSTPSIVDGGNATAITIDSSENVGIGRTPNANGVLQLNVATGNNCNITLSENATEKFLIGSITGSNALRIYDFTNSAERMRINASGHLTVGTTDDAPGAGNTSAGVAIRGGSDNRSFLSANANYVLHLNRNSSDGVIQYFAKNGTVVGSIGTGSGLLTIGTGTGNLVFENALVAPCSDSSAGSSNGVVDLGASSRRFKDLYLSGGAYLGGTAAANKLEDYEEGTWTAAIPGLGITTNRANYTKIGRVVTLDFSLTVTSTGTSTSAAQITGIPYIASGNANSEAAGSLMLLNFTADTNTVGINTYVYSRSGGVFMYQTQSNNSAWITVKVNDLSINAAIIGSITYQTQ